MTPHMNDGSLAVAFTILMIVAMCYFAAGLVR